jgi:hypothetical protein
MSETGFRLQKLQIVIFPERQEISRSDVRASLSTFQPISVSIGSKSYFGRIFDGFSRLFEHE